MIEVRHLQMISAIVESGSMTNAANKLFLTQPSLSHQLKEIESRLGVNLFLRVNKKLLLTPAGEKLFKEANEILPRLSRIENDLQNGSATKELRISTQCYTCYHWLPKLMQVFQKDFSDISLDIVAEAIDDPHQYLLNDKVDLVVTGIKVEKRGIHYEKLFDDELVLLVPPGHRLASKDFVTPKDFADEHMIIYKSKGSDFFINNVLDKAGVSSSRITKMQLTEARVELVKAGIGITVLSKWLVQPFLGNKSSIKQIRITKKGYYRTWFLATLTQKKNEPHIKSFATFLKDWHNGNKQG
jgi:LysR family transcriptional regulator, regulator for metE and metH